MSDLFDVLMMPTTGDIKTEPGNPDVKGSGFRSAFSHSEEQARPGYYQVLLKDYALMPNLPLPNVLVCTVTPSPKAIMRTS